MRNCFNITEAFSRLVLRTSRYMKKHLYFTTVLGEVQNMKSTHRINPHSNIQSAEINYSIYYIKKNINFVESYIHILKVVFIIVFFF